MYRPTYSIGADHAWTFDLIKEYPLATIISTVDGDIQTSFIPMIFEAETNCLVGHMARANPHWKNFDRNQVVLNFRGPDRYISPTWYENKLNVPTWNYAVVEVRGIAQILDNVEKVEEILFKSVDLFESENGSDWKYDLPENFKSQLVKAIVGIRIELGDHSKSIKAKFKLSQNKLSEDYAAVSRFLEKSVSTSDQDMLRWMNKTSTSKA